jgi:hypothetical protein
MLVELAEDVVGLLRRGKPRGGMPCPFPSARAVRTSRAFSGFPAISSHFGDSFRSGALTTQYNAVETTTKIVYARHSVIPMATHDIRTIPDAHQY